jgi:UDP-N-acetylmuramate--alanine ligase
VILHFVGVGGYGMSGLAEILAARGEAVSGCDVRDSARTRRLAERGVPVVIGHAADHATGIDGLVLSTDVPADNPDRLAATALGVPLLHRSEVLRDLLAAARTAVAVTGTHGKTTTSALIAHLLAGVGLDPTACVGGEVPAWGGGARIGDPALMVAEADESDGSFLRYAPDVAVITNVEPEHLEHYGHDFGRVTAAYGAFLAATRRVAVLWAGDPVLRRLVADRPDVACAVRWYGLAEDLETPPPRRPQDPLPLVGVPLPADPGGGRMRVGEPGADWGEAVVPLAGRHNLRNTLAALAAAAACGPEGAALLRPLPEFQNAHRRLEVLRRGPDGRPRVVDDYAHHPTEIRAILAALRPQTRGRLWAVFQPQRYSRTQSLWREFAQAFGDADRLILTEIYSPPGEPPIPGVSGRALAETITRPAWTRYCESLEQAEALIRAEAAPEDLVLTAGAGDVYRLAERLAAVRRA